MARKRHSSDEIAGKLRQAEAMMHMGRRQGDIARELGVSIMTYHRWRKARPDIMNGTLNGASNSATHHAIGAARGRASRWLREEADANEIVRLDELRVENDRLRRLVANLLLEKIRLEEALQSRGGVDPSAPD